MCTACFPWAISDSAPAFDWASGRVAKTYLDTTEDCKEVLDHDCCSISVPEHCSVQPPVASSLWPVLGLKRRLLQERRRVAKDSRASAKAGAIDEPFLLISVEESEGTATSQFAFS